MVEECTNLRVKKLELDDEIKVSGNLSTHYSPKAEVLLNLLPEPNDGFFAMSEIETPEGSIRLGSPANVEEFARDIYSALRLADIKKIKKISVITPSGPGLAVAIRDRLIKSARNK
jgi:L-threonylcarbamoyladenylate synthase